jgi:fatty acid desaturase
MSVVRLPLPRDVSVDSAEMDDLLRRHPHSVAFQTVFNLSAYALLSFLSIEFQHWWLWGVDWWLQGIILSGFLGAAHDCAHGTFARSAGLNRLAGSLWSSVVLFNFSLYKYFHLEHHKYTSVEGDTEPLGLFPDLKTYVYNLPTTAFFVAFWKMSAQALLGKFPHFIKTPKARREVTTDDAPQLIWILAVLSLTIVWPKQLLLAYWCPMLVYFPMVFWTSLPEHYGCDEGPNVLRNTRTTTSNRLFRYVFWNGNFHAEHHIYPNVPSCNLSRLHSLIGRHFAFRESSYILFHLRLIFQLLRSPTPMDMKALDPLRRVEYTTYDDAGPLAHG